MRVFGFYILFACLSLSVVAQDLNARVQVVSPKIQSTNKRVFSNRLKQQ